MKPIPLSMIPYILGEKRLAHVCSKISILPPKDAAVQPIPQTIAIHMKALLYLDESAVKRFGAPIPDLNLES